MSTKNTKHTHRGRVATTAKAHIKRAINAGEAAAGQIARDTQQAAESKQGSEHDDFATSVAKLNNSHEHTLENVETNGRNADRLPKRPDDQPPKREMFASRTILLFFFLGLLNALYISYHQRILTLNERIPLHAVLPWICVSFLVGRYFDSILAHLEATQEKRISGVHQSYRSRDPNAEEMYEDKSANNLTEQLQQQKPSRTRQFLHKLPRGRRVKVALSAKKKRFWSNLALDTATKDVEGLENAKQPNLNIISYTLMNHLLTYPDFKKAAANFKASGAVENEVERNMSDYTKIVKEEDNTIGQAVLPNAKNVSFEEYEKFSHIVEPMCSLRGMDLFLCDDPESEIWRQPLLTECGLRRTPTFIANMMLPFGNMTVYLELPKWFDNWDNLPSEKDDDEPEVKALKRFLAGDDEYRNLHAKLVPFVVDGPMAIRLIRPKPQDFTIHGARHPITWKKVPKSIDPNTGTVSSALLECDVDLFTNKTIRQVTSMVRPHLSKITIDIAFIVSKPQDSNVEPSACLGMWRIDKVDFESCAVFPQKSVDEVAEVVKGFIALEEQECCMEEVVAK